MARNLMSIKGLQLNRDKIDGAIAEYADGTQIEIKKISDIQSNYTITVPGEEPAMISIYGGRLPMVLPAAQRH